jgi:CO dehydrogenase maturation factor
MGYVIAITGKGGTGKTTIAALIIRLIKEKKLGSLLAIDADPNSNLGEALGLEQKETIGAILDEVAAHPDKVPAGMSKDRFIEYQVQTAILEGEGFDLLVMGRPEGPGCYCYVNNVLRSVLGKLIQDYEYVIIDNEAGLEHLSRRTTRSADALVVVSDATQVGLKSAKRIHQLTKELDIKIKKRLLIINKATGELEEKNIKDLGLDYLGDLPLDENISKASLSGDSLLGLDKDTLSLKTLRKIGESIWQRN